MRTGSALRGHVVMLFCGIAFAAAPAQAAEPATCPHADDGVGAATAAELEAATLCLVNAERSAAGRSPLTVHSVLTRTAEAYATQMVETQHFAHVDPSGNRVADRVFAIGRSLDPWLELGENLGWGTSTAATPRSLVTGWMSSPSHRDNILYSRFDRLGVGVAPGTPAGQTADALTYVAVFGDVVTRKPARRKRCSRTRVRSARACRSRVSR